MCFRYRLDFYPLFEFLAVSGLIAIAEGARAPGKRLVAALAVVSILGSLLVGAAYLVGQLGPGQLLIGDGVGAYYLHAFGLR
ncbi:hypothetical protein [uncultured Sphingomonas sp.]|uniref:hypothetical protein n=1 Tax=uncultured Sphingomonas sp. TaxID=158754 RepID=UPI0025EA3C30|nr:hypothetical protein [uncultured Sphingomonas sp.]